MLLSLKSNKETKPASTAGFFLSALSHPHKLHLRKLLIGNRIAHTAACRQRNGGQALKQNKTKQTNIKKSEFVCWCKIYAYLYGIDFYCLKPGITKIQYTHLLI